MLDRRRALASLAALAAGASLSRPGDGVAASPPVQRAAKPLKILVLGGTRFIGLHMAEAALRRGHVLTFFNRGRTHTDRFPEIERIKGDRNSDVAGLANRRWDAVIDNSGYFPRQVTLAGGVLAPNVGRYLFVSSISVYPDFSVPRDEDSPVGKLADESIEKVDNDTYGPLKALSEKAAFATYGERTTVLRPGLIVGPDDNTDRFTYWPARAARGGTFLAPGTPRDPIQVIDVRDLAEFTIRCLEREIGGTYNLVSPPGRFTIGQLVDASIAAAKRLAKPAQPPVARWGSAAFLESQKIEAWSDMPVWVPASGDSAAMAATPAKRALAAGLGVRPLGETVNDTLAWHLKRPASETAKLKAGLTPEREAAALAALDAAKG
ncbi:MAG: NAD-dependent epimerase/dehydratase family protein [Steroidobacteraceae bacterium]